MKSNAHLFRSGEALSLVIDRFFDGKHSESTHSTVLSDLSKRRQEFPFTDDVIGYTIYNISDGSSGVISARTQSTVTATLTGGTGNNWVKSDVYVIGENALIIQEQSQLRQVDYEQLTVVTPGTAIQPSSNLEARAVRILNNNTDGRIVYVGLTNAAVDGSVSPAKGIPLYEGDSTIMYVKSNANEVNIDASLATTLLDCIVLGV